MKTKKEYVKPQTQVVEMGVQQMLCASGITEVDNGLQWIFQDTPGSFDDNTIN